MLCLVYAVFVLCWIWFKLYFVYAILGACCTLYELMIIAWRDTEGWLDFVFCSDGWIVDEEERWVEDLEWYGGYEQIWEIRCTIGVIGFRGPAISVITRWIRSYTCHIDNGKLTYTLTLLRPSFSWWFPISSLLLSLFSSTPPSPTNMNISPHCLPRPATIMS